MLPHLRSERERSAVDKAADRDVPPTSGAVRMAALAFTRPAAFIIIVGEMLEQTLLIRQEAVS